MQFRVRVKTNDNENVEEWWPPSLILGGLANDLLALIGFQAETIELLIEWNTKQQARIERLERILARNGTAEAIELRSQLIREGSRRYVSEEPEPNGARFREAEGSFIDEWDMYKPRQVVT